MEALVSEFGKQTFDLKSVREKEVESTSVTSTASNFVSSRVHSFLEAAEGNPWLWVVAIFAVLIPLIGISVFCFGRKTSRVHPKKTDEVQADEVIALFFMFTIST
jgi:hypothetical protein